MVRINIEIPDDLHRNAKSQASLNGIKLKEFIIKSIEDNLK